MKEKLNIFYISFFIFIVIWALLFYYFLTLTSNTEELYIRYIPTTQEMREEYIIDQKGDTAWAVYTIKVQKHYTKTKQVY